MNTLLIVLTLSSLAAPDVAAKEVPVEKTVHHELLPSSSSKKAARRVRNLRRSERKAARITAAATRKQRQELQDLLALQTIAASVKPPVEKADAPRALQTTTRDQAATTQKKALSSSSTYPSGAAAQKRPPPLLSIEDAGLSKALIPLFILAAFALFFTLIKKRNNVLAAVRVLESTTIGKGRQILVVEIAGQRLLLGSSEAGIAVLKDRIELPTSPKVVNNEAAPFFQHPAIDALRRMLGLKDASPPPATASFESHLTCETSACSEDEELRRKLSARLALN